MADAETKIVKHSFKNTTEGPKGINLPGDVTYMVEAGAEVEAEITEAEANSAARTGWFEIDGGKFKGKEATAWDAPKVTPVAAPEPAPAEPAKAAEAPKA